MVRPEMNSIKKFLNLTSDYSLKDEIEKRKYSAAPHELMSVIVALKIFDSLFENNEERSFFCKVYIRL